MGSDLVKISYNGITPWNKSPLLCSDGVHGFVYSGSKSVHLLVQRSFPSVRLASTVITSFTGSSIFSVRTSLHRYPSLRVSVVEILILLSHSFLGTVVVFIWYLLSLIIWNLRCLLSMEMLPILSRNLGWFFQPQWFSTFLIQFSAIELFSLLLHNCHFATVLNCKVNL